MQLMSPDGQYPLFPGDLRLRQANWDGTEENLPDGWQIVAETEPPVAGENEFVELGTPEVIDGVLTQTWVTRPLTTEELEVRSAPASVNQKFLDLGFTQTEIAYLLSRR